MAQDLSALTAALNIVVDAVNDTSHALGSGSAASSWTDYGNLLPDVMALIPKAGAIPSEVSHLGVDDAVALVEGTAAKLNLSNAKAKAVLDAAMGIFSDLMGKGKTDIEKLAAAIQQP